MKKTIYINQTSENKNKYRNKISYEDFDEKAEDTESEAVEFIQIQHQKTKKIKKKINNIILCQSEEKNEYSSQLKYKAENIKIYENEIKN